MKQRLNMNQIAKSLGSQRRGKVSASGGYFGAIQLMAEIEARFRVPAGGGRATDPNWTERRLVPLTPRTLTRLEELAAASGGGPRCGVPAGPGASRTVPRSPRPAGTAGHRRRRVRDDGVE